MKWPLALMCLGIISISLLPSREARADQTINITMVESATVFNIRQLSEQNLVRDQRHGWRLFGKSLLSGVLGYKYGNGSSVDVKNILSAILSHNQSLKQDNQLVSSDKIRLIEMVVTLSGGVKQTIILPLQKDQVYRPNEKVRLVHFEAGVFIDRVL